MNPKQQIEAICKHPDTFKVPNDPGLRYTLAHSLSQWVDVTTFPQVYHYFSRPEFPKEVQIMFVVEACKHDSAICNLKEFVEWAKTVMLLAL